MKLSDFYEQVENRLTQSENDKKNHILKLDKVPNSNVAVYQTVQNDKNDDIKKEVSFIRFIIKNSNVCDRQSPISSIFHVNCQICP